MVPRTEVTAIPIDASLDDVMHVASDTSHTRLPIYEDDNDHIVGIIKVKRLMALFLAQVEAAAIARTAQAAIAGNGHAPLSDSAREAQAIAEQTASAFAIRDYMMEPMLVPETLAASEVLTRMRENQIQMAVVIDEYGGTAGIVTLQDIVTHLIGRVQEHGDEDEQNGHTPDGILHMDGLTGLVELREQYDIDLLDKGYDVETLGGYVFFVLGRPAVVADEVIAPGGQTLVVEAMEGLRVSRVQVVPADYVAQLEEPEQLAMTSKRTAA
jgi:CBS domain containing-hemolysin-like protein